MHALRFLRPAFLFATITMLLLICLPSCASALDVARTTTIVSGEATLAARDVLEEKRPELVASYAEQARAAYPQDEENRLAEFNRLAQPLLVASRAVDAAVASWRVMVASLLAWEAGDADEPSWQRAAFCIASAVTGVIRGLSTIGVDPPPVLAQAARDLGSFADQVCELVPSGSARGGTAEAGAT